LLLLDELKAWKEFIMIDCYSNSCLHGIGRLSNEDLGALLAASATQGKGTSQQLFAAIAPLLSAFYEGQVQAGRAKSEHVEALVQEAFMAVYQRCASYNPAHPTRAWLLEIARRKLLDYMDSALNQGAEALVTPLPDSSRASRYVTSKVV